MRSMVGTENVQETGMEATTFSTIGFRVAQEIKEYGGKCLNDDAVNALDELESDIDDTIGSIDAIKETLEELKSKIGTIRENMVDSDACLG